MTQTALAGTIGFPPIVKIEKDYQGIYEHIWKTLPEYRTVSPGDDSVPAFLAVATPHAGATVIDFGCGTGKASNRLADSGLFVEALDFARNCLDDDVAEMAADGSRIRFTQHDLTQPLAIKAEYGFCSDVLEHIPEEKIDAALTTILSAARFNFLVISTQPDHFGEHVGHPLHVTVHDKAWWEAKLKEFDATIRWSDETPHSVAFYLTAWRDAQELVDIAVLNIGEELIRENVRRNTEGDRYQQVMPFGTQEDVEVLLVGGGPSLSQFEDEIRERRAAGAKLVTLNNAYVWAVERGLKPSATVVVDARPFNARFVRPVVDKCLYFIASQCDPSVYEGLPIERVWQWHTMQDQVKDILDENLQSWMSVPGGSTVLLRAIPLLRTLGYAKFHLYGCDSCLADDAHHAYAQPENDCEVVIPISCGGRIFRCHSWMAAQAQEWITLIAKIGESFDCQVHGDGLLAHIINTAATAADLQEIA